MTDLSENFVGEYLDYVDGDANSNDGDDKKSLKPHAQVHLLSATENCKICGERAARHVHYGATTCFSCRAFFRRSLQKNTAAKYVCRRQSACEINCKTRKNCQYCRYMKCLAIGMNPNYVLSEEERKKRFRKKNHSGNSEPDSNLVTDVDFKNISNNFKQGLEHLQEKEENENKYLSVIEANKNILVENEQNFNGTSDTPSQMEQITEEPIFDQNFKQIHTQEYPSLSKSTSVITSAQSQTFVDVQSRNSIIVKNETPSNNTEQQFQQVNNDLSTFERKPSWLSNNENYLHLDSKPNIAVLEAGASDAVPLLDHSMIYNAFDDIETSEFEENNTNADLEELKQRLLEQDIKDDIFSMENVESELSNIVKDHDHVYYSVNFGEVLIKELLMCSMFGVQMSTSAALQCYKLQVEKVTRIANNLKSFTSIVKADQNSLLKENADLIVSLWGAMFFDQRKKGMDQIMSSMGLKDRELIQNVFSTLMVSNELNHIDYNSFNTIQDPANNQTEVHHKALQKKVADSICDHKTSILMTYIILFSSDFVQLDSKKIVEKTQFHYLKLLEHHIFSLNAEEAPSKLAAVLHAVTCLREMADIKKSRLVNQTAFNHFNKNHN